MSLHDTILADAAGLAALPESDPERVAAFEHARACDACKAALEQGLALVALLDAAPAPEPPSREALSRASAAVLAELDRAAAPRPSRALVAPAALAGAVVLAWAALVAFARHRAPGASAALPSVVVLAMAVAAAVGVATRRTAPVLVAALGASAVFALFAGHGDALAPAVGLHCVASELASAVLPLAAALWAARSRALDPSAQSLGAIAAAGALGGQAALHLTCPAHAAAPHLWAFHVGGVALAAALGAFTSRLRAVRALA